MKKFIPLIQARVKAGYFSQGDFAEKIGIHRTRVNIWENCRFKEIPSGRALSALSETLNLEVGTLIKWFTKYAMKK